MIEIPAEWRVAGYVIDLGIWAGSMGYEHEDIRISIPVVPVNEGEPEATLALDEGFTNNSIYVNQEITFTLSVPEGKIIDDVKLWAKDYFDQRGYSTEDSSYRCWFYYDNDSAGKHYQVFALVRFSDSEDYVMTNTVDIDVISIGTTGKYDFTVLDEVTVTRGNPVSFTFTPSENATEYWVDAFDEFD